MSAESGGTPLNATAPAELALRCAASPVTSPPDHRKLVRTDVPGVYRRGSRYVAITRHKGKQHKTYHRTKTAAKAAKAARDAGERPTSREPFEAYAERWLREYNGRTARGLSESTRERYAAHLRDYAIPFFRGRRIGDIGPLAVKEYIDHLARVAPRVSQKVATRLAPATVRSIVGPLKAMLAEAYELEIIRSDPSRVRVVVNGERAIKPPKTMTGEQLAAVLGALPERDRMLFAFISRTGVRISEALGAQWRDIEQSLDGPVFTVRRQYYRGRLQEGAKTEAGSRSVALLPSVIRALLRHRAESTYGGPDDPIFPSITGWHQDAHNLRRRLRPAAEAAGVPWVTPHVFRHSLATELRDRGYGADVIAKVLGHTDEAFTRRVYIHTKDAPRFDDIDLPVVAAIRD